MVQRLVGIKRGSTRTEETSRHENWTAWGLGSVECLSDCTARRPVDAQQRRLERDR